MRRGLEILGISLGLFAGGLLAGCSGDSSKPAVEPAMSTVGTLSEESAAEPVVQDTNAVRQALESEKADEAFTGIYKLINRAIADNDVQHGAALIRRELPALVATFEGSYPVVHARVSELQLKTNAGARCGASLSTSSVRNYRFFDPFEPTLPVVNSPSGLCRGGVLRTTHSQDGQPLGLRRWPKS